MLRQSVLLKQRGPYCSTLRVVTAIDDDKGESNRVCFLGANNVGKSPTDERARDEIPGRSAPQAQPGLCNSGMQLSLTALVETTRLAEYAATDTRGHVHMRGEASTCERYGTIAFSIRAWNVGTCHDKISFRCGLIEIRFVNKSRFPMDDSRVKGRLETRKARKDLQDAAKTRSFLCSCDKLASIDGLKDEDATQGRSITLRSEGRLRFGSADIPGQTLKACGIRREKWGGDEPLSFGRRSDFPTPKKEKVDTHFRIELRSIPCRNLHFVTSRGRISPLRLLCDHANLHTRTASSIRPELQMLTWTIIFRLHFTGLTEAHYVICQYSLMKRASKKGASGRHMQHDTPSSLFTSPPSLPVTAASHAVSILLDNPTKYLILGLGWVGSTEQTTTTTVVRGVEKLVFFFPQFAVEETESEQGDKRRDTEKKSQGGDPGDHGPAVGPHPFFLPSGLVLGKDFLGRHPPSPSLSARRALVPEGEASRSLPAEVLLCKPWLYLSSSPVPCLILSLSPSLSQLRILQIEYGLAGFGGGGGGGGFRETGKADLAPKPRNMSPSAVSLIFSLFSSWLSRNEGFCLVSRESETFFGLFFELPELTAYFSVLFSNMPRRSPLESSHPQSLWGEGFWVDHLLRKRKQEEASTYSRTVLCVSVVVYKLEWYFFQWIGGCVDWELEELAL
ncbi:hypothetical protein CCUS01_16401 [Colletotrichum cuscutae]|uniref:Uncharacterized protein n=1 Tax=Colletotrichum cuscutae TaxID=1209917 RepID=A0AAI9VDB7_9PEZI|nr:hypothetical protein CCUS01_16401 [Colletotrichum cuscutae]